MKSLFDTKPNVLGIVVTIVLLTLGFLGLINGLPFSYLYLMTAGIIGAIFVWGFSGLKDLFHPLRKGSIKYIILGYIWNLVQSFSLALIFKYLFHFNFASNPATGILNSNNIIDFIKHILMIITSLVGEELIVLVPVCIVIYYIKKTGVSNTPAMIIASILSAVLFGAMHYTTYQGNLVQIAVIGLARLPFNWVAFKSNSVTGSVITHCAFDISTFMLF